MNKETKSAFNAAINFALDEAEENGLVFLAMWREGDWNGIAKEFPNFDLNTVNDPVISASYANGLMRDEFQMPPMTKELSKCLNKARSIRSKV